MFYAGKDTTGKEMQMRNCGVPHEPGPGLYSNIKGNSRKNRVGSKDNQISL
jgi:hypothetical protein